MCRVKKKEGISGDLATLDKKNRAFSPNRENERNGNWQGRLRGWRGQWKRERK